MGLAVRVPALSIMAPFCGTYRELSKAMSRPGPVIVEMRPMMPEHESGFSAIGAFLVFPVMPYDNSR